MQTAAVFELVQKQLGIVPGTRELTVSFVSEGVYMAHVKTKTEIESYRIDVTMERVEYKGPPVTFNNEILP